MRYYKADAISRDEIRKYVRLLKKNVGLEYELYFPILSFVENILPILIPDFQFEVVPEAEMGNKHGETYPSKNLIRKQRQLCRTDYDGKCSCLYCCTPQPLRNGE